MITKIPLQGETCGESAAAKKERACSRLCVYGFLFMMSEDESLSLTLHFGGFGAQLLIRHYLLLNCTFRINIKFQDLYQIYTNCMYVT